MTTGACPPDVRWLVLAVLVACSHPAAPPPVLAGQGAPRVELDASAKLISRGYRDLALVELPPLPARRGLDLREEASCRAHLDYVRRVLAWDVSVSADEHDDALRRLARVARAHRGDCRIDADALLAADAPRRVGGCTGSSTAYATRAWTLVAVVASTPGRRAAASANVARIAWRHAESWSTVEAWIAAGEAHVRALRASTGDATLARWAVAAYENALRTPRAIRGQTITAAQVARIASGLARITEGPAADRARAIRAQLST